MISKLKDWLFKRESQIKINTTHNCPKMIWFRLYNESTIQIYWNGCLKTSINVAKNRMSKQNRTQQFDFIFKVKIKSPNSLKTTIKRHVFERIRRSSYHFTMSLVVFSILNWCEVINATMKSHLYETNCQIYPTFGCHFDSNVCVYVWVYGLSHRFLYSPLEQTKSN